MNKQQVINLLLEYLAHEIKQRRQQGESRHEYSYQMGLLMGIIWSQCYYDSNNWRRLKQHIEQRIRR